MTSDPLAHKMILVALDSMSAMAIVATLLGLLPSIAALAGIIWYGIQIYESKTVQAWVNRKKPDDNEPDHTA